MADWSPNAPVADVPCPFGHGGERRRVVDTIWQAEGAAEYQCGECGIVFLYPIMTLEEEKEFYEGQFAEYMPSGARRAAPTRPTRSRSGSPRARGAWSC